MLMHFYKVMSIYMYFISYKDKEINSLFLIKQMKCEKYWPDRDTEAYGNVEVTVLNQDAYSAYVIRTLNVTCGVRLSLHFAKRVMK